MVDRQPTEPLVLASQALAPMRFCPEGCSHGGGCTRPRGHDGNHQSEGTRGVLCEWTQDGVEVIPPNPKIDEEN